MPRNFANMDWRNNLGSKFEEIYNTYLDTLGNLTLTGYNSSLSDNSFSIKKEKLLSSSTKIKFLNKEFFESDKWTDVEILQRANRLGKVTIDLFPSPKLHNDKYHSKISNDFYIIDLENGEDPTNTTPFLFEFNGERNSVKTFQEILKITMGLLYKTNKSRILELALTDYPLGKSKRNNPYITILSKQKLLRRPITLENTDICFESNLSSKSILQFISDLLLECKIENFVFNIFCKK